MALESSKSNESFSAYRIAPHHLIRTLTRLPSRLQSTTIWVLILYHHQLPMANLVVRWLSITINSRTDSTQADLIRSSRCTTDLKVACHPRATMQTTEAAEAVGRKAY